MAATRRKPRLRLQLTSSPHRWAQYRPRVVGVRTGRTLLVRNDDDLPHNVHSLSGRGNGFNVSEPKAGIVQQFRLKDEETMVRVKCDIHSWMTAFVGVVSHPYFAVSDGTGSEKPPRAGLE